VKVSMGTLSILMLMENRVNNMREYGHNKSGTALLSSHLALTATIPGGVGLRICHAHDMHVLMVIQRCSEQTYYLPPVVVVPACLLALFLASNLQSHALCTVRTDP
jgi:hypothetical protein